MFVHARIKGFGKGNATKRHLNKNIKIRKLKRPEQDKLGGGDEGGWAELYE